MPHYLLSTYAVAGEVPGAPQSPDEMQAFMTRLIDLEAAMDAAGAFVFSGGLTPVNSAQVLNPDGGGADGPFAKAAEQLAGFYIIDAETDEAAHVWATKVAEATNHPIELRRFHATGKVADHIGG